MTLVAASRRRAHAPLVALLAAMMVATPLILPAFAQDKPSATVAASGGQAVYDSAFKNLQDQTESLAKYKGKVMVIYFWATWCVPCRIETPRLVKLYADYKSKDVEVVGIALDNGDKVRQFVNDNHVTYPIYYGNAVALGKRLGNTDGAIPFMVVIDKAGKVVDTLQGDLPDGKLEAILNPLIG